MAKNVEKKHFVDAGWPTDIPGHGHYVTELVNKLTGAGSPFGDDQQFPLPVEAVGYVHPTTHINGGPQVG